MTSTLHRASPPDTGTAGLPTARPTPTHRGAVTSPRSGRAWRFLSTSITVVVLGAAVAVGVHMGTSGPTTSPVQPASVAGTDTTTTDGAAEDAPDAVPDDDGAAPGRGNGDQLGTGAPRQDGRGGGGRGR